MVADDMCLSKTWKGNLDSFENLPFSLVISSTLQKSES